MFEILSPSAAEVVALMVLLIGWLPLVGISSHSKQQQDFFFKYIVFLFFFYWKFLQEVTKGSSKNCRKLGFYHRVSSDS